MSAPVYLDCAASCPLDPRVYDLLRRQGLECGNPGSRTHEYGRRARQAVEHARDQVASVIAARRSEIIFTSGATESNNIAILGLAEHGQRSGRGHIVTTRIEHPAVLEPIAELERRGFAVTRVAPTAGGWVESEAVLAAVRGDTLLVSVMHVNNETGVIQPVEEIARGLEGSAVQLHVDAAQSFAKLAGLDHPRIDLLSASAHKIMGPQGIGMLMVRRRDAVVQPVHFGGGQERGLRPGTLPVDLIAGFGLAAELAVTERAERLRLAARYKEDLLTGLAPLQPWINGDQQRCSPYAINLSFWDLDSEAVMDAWAPLAAVSNGSACASQQAHCSYVLSAMGIEAARAEGAVRLSWCPLTPHADWAAMTQALRSYAKVRHGQPA